MALSAIFSFRRKFCTDTLIKKFLIKTLLLNNLLAAANSVRLANWGSSQRTLPVPMNAPAIVRHNLCRPQKNCSTNQIMMIMNSFQWIIFLECDDHYNGHYECTLWRSCFMRPTGQPLIDRWDNSAFFAMSIVWQCNAVSVENLVLVITDDSSVGRNPSG